MLDIQKKYVVEMARTATEWGLCKHKAGNSSVRDKDTGLILVTPTTIDKMQLTPRDIVVMDVEANVIENESGLRPTSECLMHIEIYKTRPDVFAISHTHSLYATSFAVLNKPIPAVVYECAILNLKDGVIPVAPYGRPGTPALSSSVIEPIKRADAILMEKHGAIGVDKDPYEAVLKSAYLEEMAQIYYHVLAINGGKEPESFAPEELQRWAYPSQINFTR
ncbi:class II aldolase/adducin family protein [Salmonella enterica subsp. VII serovar 1,40:g,z51:--]|nr:class II aldolase/adducin family protein [Salmonella enterica subsp. VII str. CFSAN000550]EDU6369701.1 class II aldolase/adducin family protein [Salmonella enterica subsp. houtenae serovar 40:z4,z24:-]EDU7902037.1 class II aldolase/adducin family protein [Salmonella enterica subsp. houtenae]EEO7412141.1 class II aldolase/adducin family protein [Salmonella enterica]QJY68514.1 class II aldolase/adducin family protein [Salmonella enterica subsp. VII serovar 1,40:g,z51:--]